MVCSSLYAGKNAVIEIRARVNDAFPDSRKCFPLISCLPLHRGDGSDVTKRHQPFGPRVIFSGSVYFVGCLGSDVQTRLRAGVDGQKGAVWRITISGKFCAGLRHVHELPGNDSPKDCFRYQQHKLILVSLLENLESHRVGV